MDLKSITYDYTLYLLIAVWGEVNPNLSHSGFGIHTDGYRAMQTSGDPSEMRLWQCVWFLHSCPPQVLLSQRKHDSGQPEKRGRGNG